MKNVEVLSGRAAKVLANNSCKKILDALSHKKMSASELASKLKMSASKVHYNLEQLQNSGLVITKSFKYSPKGKEMQVYEPANKVMVFAPNTDVLKQFLQTIIPMAVIFIAALWLYSPESIIPPQEEALFDVSAKSLAMVPEDQTKDFSSFIEVSFILFLVMLAYFLYIGYRARKMTSK